MNFKKWYKMGIFGYKTCLIAVENSILSYRSPRSFWAYKSKVGIREV